MPILSGQGSDRRQPEDDSFKVMSSSAATSRDDGGGGVQGGGNGLAKSGPQSPPNPRQLLSRLAQAEAAVRLQQQQTPPKLSSLGEPSSPFPLSQLASSPLGSPGRDHILLNGKRVSSSITTMSSCSATSALAAAISSTKTSSITSQDGVLVGAHLKTVSTKISSSISSSSSHVVVKEEEDRGSPSSLVSPSLTIDERSDKENEEDRQKGSSRQDGDNNKKVQNNNTSSYAPGGGRLKFFKDGRCLLELSHRTNGDQSEMWAPVTKKVFWPPTSASVGGSHPPSSLPPTTTPLPSSTLVKSENGSALSDTTSTADAVSIPSPWHTSAAMLHRAKGDPVRLELAKLPEHVRRDLSFVMKPPPAVHSIMRKFKHLRKKHRRPYQPIVIGNLLMKMETQAVIARVKRRPYEMDRIKQASRLESFVSKINSLPKRKPIFQIQSWDGTKLDNNPRPAHPPKRISTNTHVGNGPNLISTHPTTGVTRVKSELCPVTETCTAATMPLPSQTGGGSRNSGPNKIKTEHRGSLGKVPNMSSYLPGSQKMMPITAVPARIKSEVGPQSIISSSHIMPDMHRIKMEISGTPGSGLLNRSLPNMSASHSMSPGMDPRESSFISPRKRLLHHSFDVGKNGSSPAKKHRLSTDSRGSAGSSDGTSSPHVPMRNTCQSPRASSGSPFNLPALAASPPRAPVGKSNSFSIDSIMNKGDQENRLVRPRPIPAGPARVSDIKRDMDMESNSSRSPTPASSVLSGMRASPVRSRSPPNIQLSTYAARSGTEVPYIDPYVAHLAGVAADPRLGLNHANSGLRVPYSLGSMMSPLFHQQMLANNAVSSLAASQLAAVSGLWTPPVVTSSVAASLSMGNPSSQASPLPSHMISTPKTIHGSMMGGDRVLGSGNTSWSTPQYRGAPRVATPERPIDVSSTDDVPLDLCTKR